MSGGALLQLAAKGPQNEPLCGNPETTFFQLVARRHTNFAIESISHLPEGQINFGQKMCFTLSKAGDLISKSYFQITLPKLDGKLQVISWIPHIGEFLIKEVDILINGKIIDRHYGEWLHIWRELSLPESKLKGYNRMIGNVSNNITPSTNKVDPYTLLIPLQFWFCKHYGLAIPLIAMEYSTIKINVTLAKLDNLILVNKILNSNNKKEYIKNYQNPMGGILQPKLWVNYVFLDNLERQYFASKPHYYLIDQLQFNGELSITSSKSNNKKKGNELEGAIIQQHFPINFCHPIKELIWVTKTKNNLPGNYSTDKIDQNDI